MNCNDENCTCKAVECINCGNDIPQGDIVCSNVCADEIELHPSWDYDSLIYPHSA